MNNKNIELPDDLEVCDDCGEEYPKSEMHYGRKTSSLNVVRQYCKYCSDLHDDLE